MRWWTFELGREGPVSGFRTTAVGEWVESGYDGIRAVFHGEPINARCDQSRTLPRLLRAAPQAGIQDIQHNTAQRLACTCTSSFTFAHRSDPSFFSRPVSILVFQTACESCAIDLGPPAKPRPSPVPPVHARMRPLLPRPTSQSQADLRTRASVASNGSEVYVHTI